MSGLSGIPRISLTWLLVAQSLVIVPHLGHLPLWVVGLWLVCTLWRVQIYRMRAGFPSRAVRIGLLILVALGVFLSRGTLVGLDGGVVLLIAAFLLKLLEMRNRRDALVLIFLGFFVVVTAYLFDDSILVAAFSLLPVCALFAALIGLQQSSISTRPWRTLRLSMALLLQALPLMLLLFVFFPRMGPLWSLPVPNERGAVTGLADSMAPADIAELTRSGELAFRASFEGPVPARSELYWRALTLDQFDGRRWSQSASAEFAPAPQWQPRGEALRYSVVMQPTTRPWLFGLDVAQTDLERTRQMGDFRLQRSRPVDRALLYEVTSWPQALREPEGRANGMDLWLRLPQQGDPRSRAWAEELRQQHGEDEALVQALLQHFNRQPYAYTLRPQTLGENSIDEFLFETRSGFCAHYAGAMVFVLRAAGIPSRVVAGYQGGEISSNGSYVQVRQFDAHAWVEYWQPGKGWSSVDPTFQVAPERIESGLEQALAEEQSFLADSPFSPLRYRNISWINSMRLAWDELNYGWQRWVLGYQGAQQFELLQRWFGQVNATYLALSLVAVLFAVLGLLSLWLFKPWRRERDPLLQLFQRFERLLAQQGLRRQTGEGVRIFASRAAAALPEQARLIEAFAKDYEAQRYAGHELATPALRKQLQALRRALPWRWSRTD